MPDLAPIAAVLADRTRTRMLEELLGGVALPVGALATRAGVAPSTASGHLARLEAAGLVVVEPHGRRRDVRLAGPHVAEALEALSRLVGDTAPRPVGLRAVNRREALHRARSCYDHLAGRAGVGLADALVARGALVLDHGAFAVGDPAVLAGLGVDVERLRTGRRTLVRACEDWTERRPHVAGAVGAALLTELLGRGWLRRRADGRALDVTRSGLAGLAAFGVDVR